MGTAKYQIGRVYFINSHYYQATKSQGVTGKEKVTLIPLTTLGAPLKRKQQYR
jgi:hypothetical protein